MERHELWDGWSVTLSTACNTTRKREVAAALAALLRSLGFEKVTVVFEQPPAT